jgi:hypothetical protein
MQATELIRWSFQISEGLVSRMLEDLGDNPLQQPTAHGGNHPFWIMGHLTVIEGGLAQILVGGENPVEHWWPLFGIGTQPQADASSYPPFGEIVSKFRELRAKNIQLLDEIGEARLGEKPQNVPLGFEEIMQTMGQTLLLTSLHTMTHAGQLTVVRKSLGLQPRI